MSHKTYTTDAIVCGTRNSNTADRSYRLFTAAAGMVYAHARSVREERSKQRMALQDFSHVRVSLVKGKSGWRIGSIEALGNYFQQAPNKVARGGVTSIVRLLRRFVTDEDPQPAVFVDTQAALQACVSVPTDAVALTDHFTLRTLATLGYIAPKPEYEVLLTDPDWWRSPADLPAIATKAINDGLHASHL